MARQIDAELTGVIGNLIFYESKGEFLVRAVPQQTANSTRSAKAFGRASAKAKILRQLLAPLLPDPKDKDMQNRLTTAMAKFLARRQDADELQLAGDPLTGFRFVPGAGLADCLKFQLLLERQTDGNITVGVPALNPLDYIAAPAETGRVQLRLMAVAFHPEKEEADAGTPVSIEIPFTNGEQAANSVVLEVAAAAEMITVVLLELSYWKGNERINEAEFMPVEIIGVF